MGHAWGRTAINVLPNAWYTLGGTSLIGPPKSRPFKTLRWPGISFTPIPHFTRYDGRGLLHGVRSLWYFMCSLLCLHNDYLNWMVNPMREIILSGLVDQTDLDVFPGKNWLTRETVSGQQAVRNIDVRQVTNVDPGQSPVRGPELPAGHFVTDAVQGLPGYRQEVTKGEAAQNLEQAMGAYSLMATNIEDGAVSGDQSGGGSVEANAARRISPRFSLPRIFRSTSTRNRIRG